MQRNEARRAVSLLTLIITIAVIIILSTIVVLSISKSDTIGQAKEAQFKQDIDAFKSELSLWIGKEYGETKGALNLNNVNATKSSGSYKGLAIQDIIKNMKDDYASKLEIKNGKLVYVGDEEREEKWTEELGLGLALKDETQPDGRIKQISSNGDHNLVLMKDGTVKSWGNNSCAQLGAGYIGLNQKSPVNVASEEVDLLEIANRQIEGLWSEPVMSDKVTVRFVSDDGMCYNGFIINKIRYVENGETFEEDLAEPIINVNYGENENISFVINKFNATSISVNFALLDVEEGMDYIELLNSTDTVVHTYSGALYLDSLAQIEVPHLTGVKEIIAGRFINCAIMENGTVKTWGVDLRNITDRPFSLVPKTVDGLTNVKQIVLGGIVNFALTNDGQVMMFGGMVDLMGEPMSVQPIPELVNIKKIGSGLTHYVFLMNDGTVKEMGVNVLKIMHGLMDEEETGDDELEDELIVVPGLNNVIDISVGSICNIAHMEDGSIKTWGYNMDFAKRAYNFYNFYGSIEVGEGGLTPEQEQELMLLFQELGFEGDLESVPFEEIIYPYTETPVTIEGTNNVKDTSVGSTNLAVISSDDSMQIYGVILPEMFHFMLYQYSIMGGMSIIDYVGLSYGVNQYSYFLIEDVYDETSGMIGLSLDSPIQNSCMVSAGNKHILILLKDGTLKALGNNRYGQLGDGTNTDKITPITVTIP